MSLKAILVFKFTLAIISRERERKRDRDRDREGEERRGKQRDHTKHTSEILYEQLTITKNDGQSGYIGLWL